MNEVQKTGIFLGVATTLGALTMFTGGRSQPTLEQFSDQGEAFYANFVDPGAAASLEVIDYDEESGSATPFKVQVKDGVWTIPSHYNYPADGEDRLAKTAAGVIDLEKDIVQSDRTQDHEALSVIDPIDETNPTLKGRGQRVTLRDASGGVLADFIIGSEVQGKNGFRYVRVPDQKRTYAVKMDIDISTKFADWIETNLLDVNSSDIQRIQIQDYSVDEATGTVNSQGMIALENKDNQWTMVALPEDKELETSPISSMTSGLANITITGIRPKPAGLSQDLRTTQGLTMDLPTQMSLQSKGYFVSQDGRLLSNEGEVAFGTSEGVLYTLRFGEILLGEGFNISAGFETEGEEGTASENEISAIENRYLFVTAQFDESLLPTKPDAPEGYTPADANPAPDENIPPRNPSFTQYEQDLETWQQNLDQSIARATELNARFAPWYYVISSSEFEAIRPGKDKLLKDKPAPPVELEPEPLETPVDPVPTPDGSPDTDEGSTTPDG